MENNRCVICQKDFVGSKKASKVATAPRTDVSEDWMMTGGVVKDEKVKQVKALNNKEVWKTNTETLAKILMNQDNLDIHYEVTPENLGLVCKICSFTETSTSGGCITLESSISRSSC